MPHVRFGSKRTWGCQTDPSLDLYTNARLGIRIEKMAKGHEQFLRVLYPPPAERFVDIVNYHDANFFLAMRLFQEIVSQSRSCNCWNMLLPNSSHFIFTEPAKSDAVLQGDHDASFSRKYTTLPLVLVETPSANSARHFGHACDCRVRTSHVRFS